MKKIIGVLSVVMVVFASLFSMNIATANVVGRCDTYCEKSSVYYCQLTYSSGEVVTCAWATPKGGDTLPTEG